MSNQRKGKMQSRPDNQGSEMAVYKFFKEGSRIQLTDEVMTMLHFTLNKCKIG